MMMASAQVWEVGTPVRLKCFAEICDWIVVRKKAQGMEHLQIIAYD
jgi:hypothetical protein